jgi:hypothetical protein
MRPPSSQKLQLDNGWRSTQFRHWNLVIERSTACGQERRQICPRFLRKSSASLTRNQCSPR